MTMTLILGVNDIPYSVRPKSARRVAKPRKTLKVKRRPSGGFNGTTTGDVAGFLEAKYHVMQAFADLYEPEIATALEDSLAGAMESIQQGAPPSIDPFGSAMSTIEQDFRDAIDRKIFDGLIPGVPTKAAIGGVDHRLKHPYRKSNPSRPSFRDTGLYQTNFRAWIER